MGCCLSSRFSYSEDFNYAQIPQRAPQVSPIALLERQRSNYAFPWQQTEREMANYSSILTDNPSIAFGNPHGDNRTYFGINTPFQATVAQLNGANDTIGSSFLKSNPKIDHELSKFISFEATGSLAREICTICQEELCTGPVTKGRCSHYLHISCVKQLYLNDFDEQRSIPKCPTCRNDFIP